MLGKGELRSAEWPVLAITLPYNVMLCYAMLRLNKYLINCSLSVYFTCIALFIESWSSYNIPYFGCFNFACISSVFLYENLETLCRNVNLTIFCLCSLGFKWPLRPVSFGILSQPR